MRHTHIALKTLCMVWRVCKCVLLVCNLWRQEQGKRNNLLSLNDLRSDYSDLHRSH